MPDLPIVTVTFFFTDIEGSTRLWERNRTAMAIPVERSFALLREPSYGGKGNPGQLPGPPQAVPPLAAQKPAH